MLFKIRPYGQEKPVKGFYYKAQLFPIGKLENLKMYFPQATQILDQKAEKKYLSVKIKEGHKIRWVYLEPEFFGGVSPKDLPPEAAKEPAPSTSAVGPKPSSSYSKDDKDKDWEGDGTESKPKITIYCYLNKVLLLLPNDPK